jgi:hypothetical protein
VGSLNTFRAVLTGATALAVIACLVLGEYLAAAVLGFGVVVHTGLFIYQHIVRNRQLGSLPEAFEADVDSGRRSA